MPLSRRQIYRRRRIGVLGAAALVLSTAFYLPLTLLAPLQPVSAQLQPWHAPATSEPALSFPNYGSAGIAAVEYPGVLVSQGSTAPRPMASITKVITALVVLDAKPLAANDPGPDITFGSADVGYYNAQLAQNGVVVNVYPGLVMSERNALTTMLMVSANNYADSIADWAFGSHAGFVTAAAAWLKKNQLAATTVTDPSGILPTNVSSVADLISVAKIAIADPVVSAIVATKTTDIPKIGTINNRNELLGIDGVDGIKTGTLDEAGSCLLFAADVTIAGHPVTLVGVVLGGPDHATIDAAVRTLIAQATAGFHEVKLTTAGEPFGSYATAWGDTATAVAATDQTLLLWAATPVTADIQVKPIHTAPQGTDVGAVTFSAGTQTATVRLQLSAKIDDPGPWWRLGNPTRLF